MKIWILSRKYDDPSAETYVRAYVEVKRAQEDFSLVADDSRHWTLTEVPLVGDLS